MDGIGVGTDGGGSSERKILSLFCSFIIGERGAGGRQRKGGSRHELFFIVFFI
jgi:hypothetical protein